ncbi:hypothetical protein CPB84DRAFT_1765614 [Gymnopilus junonius]|uniref:Uncharacterized protein n=1 Tax=Gymnopilus junonius TaxID=109634 RepID=A0A9P5TSC5_GYMJU|nr:hypothetical protein CPB84DRAFT_1765614 [Gymnopilus junonius]
MPNFDGGPSLPLELFKAIIDALVEDGDEQLESTLRSCLLVSAYFRDLVLPHIFKNIYISTLGLNLEQFKRRVTKLFQILSPPEGVGLGLRKPGVLSTTGADHFKMIIYLGQDDSYPRWDTDDYGVSWDDFTPDFRTTFQHLASSPYLECLSIENLHGFPLNVLRGSGLKSLTLEKHTNQRHEEAVIQHEAEHLAYPVLDSLTLGRLSLFDRLKYGPLLRNVKNLSLPMDDRNEMMDIIMLARESVELLCMDHFACADLRDTYPTSFNLGLMLNLSTFTLIHSSTVFYPDVINNNDRVVSSLHQLLNVPQPMLHFRTLDLVLIFMTDGLGENITNPFKVLESNWNQIVGILSSPLYPTLSHVNEPRLDEDLLQKNTKDFLIRCFYYLAKKISVELKVVTTFLP